MYKESSKKIFYLLTLITFFSEIYSGTNTCGEDVTTLQPTTTTEAPLPCEPRGFLAESQGSTCYDAGDNCYCLYQAENPSGWVWPQADWYCKNISMSLVSIDSQEEENLLAGIADTGEFWISAKRENQDLPWTWSSTGQPLEYTNWVTPNEALKTGCATLKSIAFVPTKWFVRSCERGEDTGTFWFICENKPKETAPVDGCPTNSLDPGNYMTWNNGVIMNSTLYCFSSYWTDWNTAKRLCQDSALDLLSLESSMENEMIVQHIRKEELSHGGGFWTSGYCSFRDNSTWLWASSEQPFTFQNFDANLEACSSFTDDVKVWIDPDSEGKWYFNPYTVHRQVICEKKLN